MKPPAKPQDAAAPDTPAKGERIAKRMARAGLCSRRDAERWIEAGRVEVNGKTLATPAVTVTERDRIVVDGSPLPAMERTRLWLLHKKSGTVTTDRDPEGRPTVFERLPDDMPRVLSIGRLDINTEGLLLLTNDGGLARALELPSTGWLRRYRVRAHGSVTQEQLDALQEGVAVEGVLYGAIEAALERQQGTNVWLNFAMREGKNREVKKVLASLGLEVNRLIRLSYGPFQLGDLEPGAVREVRGRTLRDQLGAKLIAAANANFDAPVAQAVREPGSAKTKPAKPTKGERKRKPVDPLTRLTTKKPASMRGKEKAPAREKPGRSDTAKPPSRRRKPTRNANRRG